MKKKYGLIGYPLGHSFSPQVFEAIFKKKGVTDADYQLYPLEDISLLTKLIQTEKLQGFTVTIPHKSAIIPLLDSMSSEAEAIAAVNLVRVIRNNNEIKLEGFNTDAPAFSKSLEPYSLNPGTALILGGGGAALAVNYALTQQGFNTVIVSRNEGQNKISYKHLETNFPSETNLIVQCTPLGMEPKTQQFPDIPYHKLHSGILVYDLVYNPNETLFLKKAADFGARIKNGMEMLEIQAELAWEILNDVSPSTL